MDFRQTRAFEFHVQALDPALLRNRHIVRTPEQLANMVRYLNAQRAIAVDTETSGLQWFAKSRICGFVFGGMLEDAHRFYVPVRHLDGTRQLPISTVAPAIRPFLENPAITKVLHNAKFDWHMLRADGLDLRGPIRDTMIEASLYDENYLLALKERAGSDLNRHDATAFDRKIDVELARTAKEMGLGKKECTNRFGYSILHSDLVGIYGTFDVDITAGLARKYDEEGIRTRYAKAYEREVNLVSALVEMEENGLPVDLEYLEGLRGRCDATCEALEKQIFAQIGDFNLASNDELCGVLMGQMGLRWDKRTRSDLPAVDAEVLEELAEKYSNPAIKRILKWRKADKIRTTYIDSIFRNIGTDGLLHGSFRQVGTKTGRLSSSDPNLQNFAGDDNDRAIEYSGRGLEEGGIDPLSVKRAFINRRPDGDCDQYVSAFWDYSQIELRVLAVETQDPTMLDVYAKGEDIHHRTQMEVFNDPAKHLRRYAKIIAFGLAYGLSPAGFSRQTGVPLDRAERFYEIFFERYANIRPTREAFWKRLHQNKGYFENRFGRPRRVPGILALDNRVRESAKRRSFGSWIQGTAAELTKISIVRIQAYAQRVGAPIKLCQTIHDENKADLPYRDAMAIARDVKRLMEDGFPELAPVRPVTDCEMSTTNWAEKKEVAL